MRIIKDERIKEKYRILQDCEEMLKWYKRPHGVILQNSGTYSEDSGVYFAIGADIKTIEDVEFPSTIADKYKYNKTYFDPTLFIIKLGNEDETQILNRTARYMKQFHFLKDCMYDSNYPIPEKVNLTRIIQLLEVYSEYGNCSIKDETRALKRFKEVVDSIGKSPNRKGLLKVWEDFRCSERYDTLNKPLENLYAFAIRNKRKIGLKYLSKISENIKSVQISKKRYLNFKKRAKKEVMFAYSITKLRNATIQLHFKAEDEYLVMGIIHKSLVGKTVLDAKNIALSERSYGGIVVPNAYIEKFKKLCIARKIPYALDEGYINLSKNNKIPILFFSEHTSYINEALVDAHVEIASTSFIEGVQKKVKLKNEKNQQQEMSNSMKKAFNIDKIEFSKEDDTATKMQRDAINERKYFEDKIKIKEAVSKLKE